MERKPAMKRELQCGRNTTRNKKRKRIQTATTTLYYMNVESRCTYFN